MNFVELPTTVGHSTKLFLLLAIGQLNMGWSIGLMGWI